MTGKSGHWISLGGRDLQERPLRLAQLTSVGTLAVRASDRLMAISVSSARCSNRQQPLQTCRRRIPYSRNELHPTPQGFKLLAKKAVIPAVKKVVTL